MTTPGQRQLRYNGLDEVMPDVERLLDGYTTVGNWSLEQIRQHLVACLLDSMKQPPTTGRDLLRYPTAERRKGFFAVGLIDEGRKIPAGIAPPGEHDDRHEGNGFAVRFAKYAASSGPVMDHPGLGRCPEPIGTNFTASTWPIT